MATCTGCHVELRLPNRPEFVAVARLTVAAVACRMGFDVSEIEDIKVAVGEACTNAIEHGVPAEHTAEMVTISCAIEEKALRITVHDPGIGFDPSAAPGAPSHGASTATLTEGGLGLLLIQALMDDVDVSCVPEDGTRVRMVKHLRAEEDRA
jgi:serine/threonine-protein kinase RsbW